MDISSWWFDFSHTLFIEIFAIRGLFVSWKVCICNEFLQMDSLDIGSLNRSLTNSQIYDGEFFEIVGSEGEILVVR